MNSTRVERTSRVRFTLGSLFLVVTAFGGCLAALQLRFRLRDSDWFGDYVRSVVELLPLADFGMHVLLQAVTLGLAGIALYFWRQLSMLRLYVASHMLWFSVLALGFFLQGYAWESGLLSNAALCIFFLESTCALVFAGLALGQSLVRRKLAPVLTCLLILVLNLLAECCSIVELDAFGAAIAAAIR